MTSKLIPMTKARGMGPLPEMVEDMAGVNPLGRVFAYSGLPLALTENLDQAIQMRQMIAVFTYASREVGDRLFGLRVGQAMKPGAYGLWTDYATEATTLRAAILRLHRTRGVHQNMGAMHLHMHNRHAIWTYVHPLLRRADGRAHADHILPVMINVARLYLGEEWKPEWIRFFYPKDDSFRAMTDAMGCPCLYDGHGVSIALRREHLEQERVVALNRPLTATDVFAEADARDLNSGIEAFEGLANMRLLEGLTDLEGMADLVGCSSRSLQRSLEREGLTYRELLNRVKYRKATSLLTETSLSITEIALQLGYSDPAHFSRAFKNWSGRSPLKMRKDRITSE